MELIVKKYQQSSVVFMTGSEWEKSGFFIIDWLSYNYKAEQNRTE